MLAQKEIVSSLFLSVADHIIELYIFCCFIKLNQYWSHYSHTFYFEEVEALNRMFLIKESVMLGLLDRAVSTAC